MIANNAWHRAYRSQADVELAQLRAKRAEWNNERNQYIRLPERVDRLKKEKEELNMELLRLKR